MKYQHCILLPFALALIVAGVVTLLIWGVGNLEPYNHTRDFTPATCTVIFSNVSGTAKCGKLDPSNDTEAPPNVYPCLVIYVNYTEESDETDMTSEGGESVPRNNSDAVTSEPANRDVKSTKRAEEKDLVSVSGVMLFDTVASWTAQDHGDTNSTVRHYKTLIVNYKSTARRTVKS